MLGIQLYTVRDKMLDRSSIRDTLVRIKQIGYECVQLASSVEKMEITANVCREIGLSAVGLLCNIDMCETAGDKLFEIARICGAKDIGISSSIKNEDEAEELIRRANAFAKKQEQADFHFLITITATSSYEGITEKHLLSFLLRALIASLSILCPILIGSSTGALMSEPFLRSLTEE